MYIDEDEFDDDGGDDARATVRAMQMILGTMVGGVVLFCIVVATLMRGGERPALQVGPTILGTPLVTAMAAGAGLITVVLAFAASIFIVEAGLRAIARGTWPDSTEKGAAGPPRGVSADDVERLTSLFQTRLIVASALNEGAAFFGALAYMLEGRALALGVVAGSLLLILFRLPTEDRLRNWLDVKLARLAALRRDESSIGP